MRTWEGGNVGTCEREKQRNILDESGRTNIERFEDLRVWQTARELTKGIYRASRTQALRQDHSLANQMQRAAISISSNIAEGYERGTRKQQIEFCYIAKGSAGELRSQVILAHDVELLDCTAYEWCMDMCDKCSRQLAAYIQHLQRTQRAIPGMKYAQPAENRNDK